MGDSNFNASGLEKFSRVDLFFLFVSFCHRADSVASVAMDALGISLFMADNRDSETFSPQHAPNSRLTG